MDTFIRISRVIMSLRDITEVNLSYSETTGEGGFDAAYFVFWYHKHKINNIFNIWELLYIL